MKQTKNSISLQSYAFQMRKLLIQGCPLDSLLSVHKKHQSFLLEFSPQIQSGKLPFSDRFAWKFIREINILNLNFLDENNAPKNGHSHPQISTAQGVYQDLSKIVAKVQEIWFPAMENLPRIVWLNHFSTRKLAHYAKHRDEIAFSLIFDSPDAPPEILSYLAYHELLHRRVGSKIVNGRRYHHTGEFKNQEQLFPNWKEIERQIRDYIVKTL